MAGCGFGRQCNFSNFMKRISANENKTPVQRNLFRHNQQGHTPSGHLGGLLNFGQFLQRFSYLLKHCIALVTVEHLTSAEEHCKLYFVSFFEEFTGVLELDIQVVFVCFGPEPDTLEGRGVVQVSLMSISNLSLLLIQPLAVIHYPANRRVALRGNFHKVHANLAGPADCFKCIKYPHLIV